jgi:hypothetical protein
VLGFHPLGAAPLGVVPAFPPEVVAPPIVITLPGGPKRRPFLITGVGYGVLPELEGEAHGVVTPPGKGNGPDELDDVELLLLIALAA